MKRAPSSPFLDLPSITLKPHGQKRLERGHPYLFHPEDQSREVFQGCFVRYLGLSCAGRADQQGEDRAECHGRSSHDFLH